MITIQAEQACFKCNRTQAQIPVLVWMYQERPLTVCCQCIPTLIHKWEQVVATLPTQPTGEQHEQ